MSSPSNGEHDWKYRGWGERDERERERDANKIAKRRRICSMKIYFYHNNENKILLSKFYFFLFFLYFVFY